MGRPGRIDMLPQTTAPNKFETKMRVPGGLAFHGEHNANLDPIPVSQVARGTHAVTEVEQEDGLQDFLLGNEFDLSFDLIALVERVGHSQANPHQAFRANLFPLTTKAR